MSRIVATVIIRFGNTSQWASIENLDRLLAEGELGYDTDLQILKVGDGRSKWSELPIVNDKEFTGKFISEIRTGDEDSGKGTFKYFINGSETVVKVYGLGSAAYTESSAYATAAQGAKADTAIQTIDINGKAFTVNKNNATLSQQDARDALGFNPNDYAIAAQGLKADSAVQSVSIAGEKFTDDGSHNVSLTADKVRKILDLYTKSEVDNAITSAINEHNTSDSSHADIREALSTEKSAREKADTDLGTRIDNIAEAQTEGAAGLQDKIDKEVKAREEADTKFQNQLGTGFDASNTVKKAIEDLTAQQATDKSDLEDKIKAEATSREEGDKNLQDQLGDGFSTDNTVANAIEDAKTEASTAVQGINDELTKEIERAKAAEQANASSIQANTSNIQANTVSIEAEVKRAIGRENEIEGKLPTEEQLLPSVTEVDNDKILQVVEGQWQPVEFNSEEINQKIQQNADAIQKNADGLAAEIERAKGAESDLTSLITTNNDTLEEAINSEKSAREKADTDLSARVTTIESKIPTQASATNQLADKNFVNSSVAANAARFITPSADGSTLWSSFESLTQGPWYYEGKTIEYCENNDYATYLVTTSGEETPNQQWRATYQKENPVGTPGGKWVAAYSYNTVWTAKQKAAIDSGITEELVAKIGTNEINITKLQSSLSGLQSDLDDLQSDVTEAQSDIGTLQTDVSKLKIDTSTLQTNTSKLQTDVSDLQFDVTEAQSNIGTLQTDVSGLQSSTSALETGVAGVKTSIGDVQASLDTYKAEAEGKYAPKKSPTFTGSVTVPEPTQDTDAATKKYIDDSIKAATGEEAGSTDDKIKNAIGKLSASVEEKENNYITSITQTNGVVSAAQKALPVTNIKGTAPINVTNAGSVFTVSHATKEVTNSVNNSAVSFITSITADETGHLSSYITNTLEQAIAALGVITINGGKADGTY